MDGTAITLADAVDAGTGSLVVGGTARVGAIVATGTLQTGNVIILSYSLN